MIFRNKAILIGATTLILTPLGILFVVIGAHGPTAYTILGVALLLPSVALLRVSTEISIPGITLLSTFGFLIFVFLQAAYFTLITAALSSVIRMMRQNDP
jgi:hypothetical protein